jgi:hypothetical protein
MPKGLRLSFSPRGVDDNSSRQFVSNATGIEPRTPPELNSRARGQRHPASQDSAKGQRRSRVVRIAHSATAPVSHQKRSHRNAMNAINTQRKYSKINDCILYPAAHNGLVAGSSPAAHIRESPALDF